MNKALLLIIISTAFLAQPSDAYAQPATRYQITNQIAMLEKGIAWSKKELADIDQQLKSAEEDREKDFNKAMLANEDFLQDADPNAAALTDTQIEILRKRTFYLKESYKNRLHIQSLESRRLRLTNGLRQTEAWLALLKRHPAAMTNLGTNQAARPATNTTKAAPIAEKEEAPAYDSITGAWIITAPAYDPTTGAPIAPTQNQYNPRNLGRSTHQPARPPVRNKQ